ncbi:MAG: hypothetical protein FWG99_02065 [Treponema sp.]|nr:hypothetical protein [Treponema sp.]
MKKSFVFIIILLLSVSFLRAQDIDAAEGRYITGISIHGLKRTRLSTAERPLRKFIGIETEKLDTNEVWAAILDTGILEPISVEIDDEILVIVIREKWSVFPVPVLMITTDDISGGAAIYDANAFGLNDKLFVAGIFFPDGWVVTSGYFHSPSDSRLPGWNGMFIFSREERSDGNQRNETLRRFKQDSILGRLGLDTPLLENTDLVSASAVFSYNEKILRNQEKAKNGPEEGQRRFGVNTGISLKRSTWDGYLLSQEEASLNYSLWISQDSQVFHSLSFRGVWEKPFVPGFRFNFKTGMLFEPDVPVLFESSPASAQVSILPGSFSAKHYAGASAGLEKYLFKFPAGTISASAAYQIVYSHGSILGDSFDHGVTGMLSFYLSRLAIPAIGVGAAYNVKEDYFQGAFSIGMSF